MSNITDDLLREDLRGFGGYKSARSESLDGTIWLNANESPWPNAADPDSSLRRYPEPQPEALCRALAQLYGCSPWQLLIGRGSDEAIDLLVRAFCTPGCDAVLVTPPVFGMYAVCARLQGARLLEVPLSDRDDDFHVDLDQVACAALSQGAKLVFLCSPGNPAGGVLAAAEVLALARQLEGRSLVVVDEAYVEFANQPSLVPEIGVQPNLAVLRTLSKAHALAAARIGCLIAHAEVIEALRRCQAPYPVPVPCAEQALRALVPASRASTEAAVAAVRSERERLSAALDGMAGVRRVYPSQGNFLLVRFDRVEAAYRNLLDAGIVVRDMRALPQLGDALRISIGMPEQNRRVIAALRSLAEAA
jgi:histidinol-phosphate aminotransferase